jgi:hypothetical protein
VFARPNLRVEGRASHTFRQPGEIYIAGERDGFESYIQQSLGRADKFII